MEIVNILLKPLIANLKRINIGSYIMSQDFKNLALEHNYDEIWKLAKEQSRDGGNGLYLAFYSQEHYENVYWLILDSLFINNKNHFFKLLKLTLIDFKRWDRGKANISIIIGCLEVLEMRKEDLKSLKETQLVERKKMTKFEKLDAILKFYRDKQFNKDYDKGNKIWGDLAIQTSGENGIEFLQLTQKIEEDGYVKEINGVVYITPNGELFKGYSEDLNTPTIDSLKGLELFNIYIKSVNIPIQIKHGLSIDDINKILLSIKNGEQQIFIDGKTIKIGSFETFQIYDVSKSFNKHDKGKLKNEMNANKLITRYSGLDLLKYQGMEVTHKFEIIKPTKNKMQNSQEDLYQLIFTEQWTDVVNFLHTHKKAIASDTMLKRAAAVFEQEFFKKVIDYPLQRKDIEEDLDLLYTLNFGKFYNLSDDNYKKLIVEMVKRKPPNEAIPYARIFPEEEVCKGVIRIMEDLKLKEEAFKLTQLKTVPMNWIEIYNRLFELINNQGDAATYFSGSRFINTVREFEPYFPDYSQFLEQRNREGKSTSRKIFYYDILLELKEDMRLKIVDRIIEILKPFQSEKVGKIEELLGKKVLKMESLIVPEINNEPLANPIVFISYSWDNEEHKEWVLNLAERLMSDGIDVILDRYYLKPGKNLPHFVETSIAKAKRIIIVFTPNYKLKADKRAGGVGYEYSIMNADLYNNQTSNDKVIPVLRTGSTEDSIPTFMQQFIHIDIRNNDNFENSYVDLLREIYNEPAIQKPKIGVKPTFTKKNTEEVDKPVIGIKPNFKKEITGDINPLIVAKLKPNDTPLLTLKNGRTMNAGTIRIEDNHLVHYTGKGLREIYKPNMTEEEKIVASQLLTKSEEYLTENNFIAWTPLDTILDINR